MKSIRGSFTKSSWDKEKRGRENLPDENNIKSSFFTSVYFMAFNTGEMRLGPASPSPALVVNAANQGQPFTLLLCTALKERPGAALPAAGLSPDLRSI